LVEAAATFQNADAETGDTTLGEILGEAREQRIAILRAILATLLEFDDVGADEPVAEDKALVDRRWRATDRRGVGLGDGREELAVVPGEEKNGLAAERQSQGGRRLKLAVRAVPPLLSQSSC
jgi:hypothetical protein